MPRLRQICSLAVSSRIVGIARLHAGDWAAIDPAELRMKDLPEQPGQRPSFSSMREPTTKARSRRL